MNHSPFNTIQCKLLYSLIWLNTSSNQSMRIFSCSSIQQFNNARMDCLISFHFSIFLFFNSQVWLGLRSRANVLSRYIIHLAGMTSHFDLAWCGMVMCGLVGMAWHDVNCKMCNGIEERMAGEWMDGWMDGVMTRGSMREIERWMSAAWKKEESN